MTKETVEKYVQKAALISISSQIVAILPAITKRVIFRMARVQSLKIKSKSSYSARISVMSAARRNRSRMGTVMKNV